MPIHTIPLAVQRAVRETLGADLIRFSFSGGGCINQGGKLETSRGIFFLKWNDAKKYPDMFKAEAHGLNMLASPNVIDIPEVILTGDSEGSQFLVLEFIEEKSKSQRYWENLGSQLATLHKRSDDFFGLERDNYIGSLKQINAQEKNWIKFFIEHRLQHQLKLAIDHQRLNVSIAKQFDVLFGKLPHLLPNEKPALIHGDLWSGNLITNEKGEPCLIDPAVYFGNREMEIAFTRLFGGFSHRFYESYNEAFPLEASYLKRTDIFNLYPLLVHVNLFGGGYATQVVSILDQFV